MPFAAEMAVRHDGAHRHAIGILDLRRRCRIGSRRRLMDAGRRLHRERLVRAHLVEVLRYGSIVNATEDARRDVEKSTRAAARYLSNLYAEFRSWPLALAAYNTGEQNLQSAIERSRSTNFNVLSSLGLLPLKTRNYVPEVFAAAAQLTPSAASAANRYSSLPNLETVFAVAGREPGMGVRGTQR